MNGKTDTPTSVPGTGGERRALDAASERPDISVVVPVYKEEQSIRPLLPRSLAG
jgi:hypothetical protein